MSRMSKEMYYMSIAEVVSKRSTCLRRNYGAVIVKNDRVISTGYNGAPSGDPNCCDMEKCPRSVLNIPHGERYELCRSIHAEANAIMSAHEDLTDAAIYIFGRDVTTGKPVDGSPCKMCERLITNSKIKKVYMSEGEL